MTYKSNFQWPSLLFTLSIGFGCGELPEHEEDHFTHKKQSHSFRQAYVKKSQQVAQEIDQSLSLSHSFYPNCQELASDFAFKKTTTEQINAQFANMLKTSAPKAGSTSRSNAAIEETMQADVGTNNQVQGVEEGDRVKFNSEKVYILNQQKIHVYKRQDFSLHKTIDLFNILAAYIEEKPEQEIDAESAFNLSWMIDASWSGFRNFTHDLYLHQEKLIVVSANFRQVVVHSFDSSLEPTFLFHIHGELLEHRLTQGQLLLITNHHQTDITLDEQEQTFLGVDCQKIVQSPSQIYEPNFIGLHKINTETKTKESLLSPINGRNFYVSDSQVYMVQQEHSLLPWEINQNRQKAHVYRFSYQQNLDLTAVGQLSGRIKDRWSIGEISFSERPYLAIASTLGQSLSNKVTVFNEQMQEIAAIDAIAPGEEIKSARFENHMLYLVTFEQVDPLFAIDLCQPFEPKILDKLKIPGFSKYLHPIKNDLLVGLGATTEIRPEGVIETGVQLSLFDKKDLSNLQAIEQIKVGQKYSYSPAAYDQHAFFYSQELDLIGFPVHNWMHRGSSSGIGAHLYQVNATGFKPIAVINHLDFLDALPGCPHNEWQARVDRIYQIDKRILTASELGIIIFDADDFSTPIQALTHCSLD